MTEVPITPHDPSLPPTSTTPLAGWYPDPATAGSQRWWDGARWTEHLAPTYSMAPAYAQSPPQTYPTQYAQPYAPARSIGFREAVSRGLRRWKDYDGRARVAEFWWFALFEFLVLLPLEIIVLIATWPFWLSYFNAIDAASRDRSNDIPLYFTPPSGGQITVMVVVVIAFYAIALALFLPRLALTIRRLHDIDRSGWWFLIGLVPGGSIVLLVFTVMPSTPGPNTYGPPVT